MTCTTVVQLGSRPHRIRASLVHPLSFKVGDIEFPSGVILAYRLERIERPELAPTLCIVRTTAPDPQSAHDLARVPGIRPEVKLLVLARSKGRVSRLTQFFAALRRSQRDPSLLSDRFYARLSLLLAGRLPTLSAISALLADDLAP